VRECWNVNIHLIQMRWGLALQCFSLCSELKLPMLERAFQFTSCSGCG